MKLTVLLATQLGLALANPALLANSRDVDTTTEVSLGSTTTAEAEKQCHVKGECQGKVVGFSFDPTSIEECQKYCQGFPDLSPPITWVTYSSEKNFCECFEDCNGGPELTAKCPDCVSSELDCQIIQCFVPGLCTDIFLHFYSLKSQKECLNSCQDVDECDYFSFNREREICLLFATCETTSLDDPTFISGQRQCQYPQPSHVLVTTGFPKATSVKSEIINIKQKDSFCNDFPDSPIENQNAISGGVSNNLPVICGGDGGQQKCYSLGSIGKEEVLMGYQRINSASTISAGNLFISGGSPLSATANTSCNTFEVCNESGACMPGNLTFNIKDHCMVTTSDGPLIIGGLTGESDSRRILSDKVYAYSSQGFNASEAKLIDPRSDLACATFETIGFHDEPAKVVVVVGGIGADQTNVKHVEMMLEGFPFFFRGPEITDESGNPVALNSLQLVSLGDTIVAIGGKDDRKVAQDSIYELACPDGLGRPSCGWTKLEQKLQVPRNSFVAMPIDYEFVECSDPPE